MHWRTADGYPADGQAFHRQQPAADQPVLPRPGGSHLGSGLRHRAVGLHLRADRGRHRSPAVRLRAVRALPLRQWFAPDRRRRRAPVRPASRSSSRSTRCSSTRRSPCRSSGSPCWLSTGSPQPQAAGRRAAGSRSRCWPLCATVVTHHVTSYVLVATLEVITLGALLARDRPAGRPGPPSWLWCRRRRSPPG